MAPVQGRGATRGRGRGSSRGRSRGAGQRGRGGSRGHTQARPRLRFQSNRIEEQQPEESGSGDGSQGGSPKETSDGEGVSSQDSDENVENGTVQGQSFTTLLQALSNNIQRGERVRKKRRVEPSSISLDDPALGKGGIAEARKDVDGDSEEADVPDMSSEHDNSEHASLGEDEDVDDDDDSDSLDPFEAHFSDIAEVDLKASIEGGSGGGYIMRQDVSQDGWILLTSSASTDQSRTMPSRHSELHLKQKLKIRARNLLPALVHTNSIVAFHIFKYKDMIFSERTPQNAGDLRKLYCAHAINHVLKTRDKVIRNNARLSRAEGSEEIECRDQGFTRPKVLFILPTRQACARVVDDIVGLVQSDQQENRKRFTDSYTQATGELPPDRPEDFRELFDGNDDDMFRIGVKLTRKTIKFFSQFYNSDIILASPLGLRMAIGTEDSKKQDFDFLSSIEVVIVDQADALLQQNWEQVEYALEHLNLQPKATHGCDFGRVRNWYLDGYAKHLRQTLVFSAFTTPEITKLYNKYMSNKDGRTLMYKDAYEGALFHVGLQVRQTFSRYEIGSPQEDPDARFKFFTSTIIASITKAAKAGTSGQGVLIFIPSYMDFVRVRNRFASDTSVASIAFGAISEYTTPPEIARARSHFLTGRHSVLLYTARAHHFRRYRIRGAKRLVFYSLPDNPIFYRELVGESLGSTVSEGNADLSECSVQSIFSRWDRIKLERIVGTKRLRPMLRENSGDTFEFS